MAGSISFHGRKKLSTLQKEFTGAFPFLGLKFFTPEEHEKSKQAKTIYAISNDQSLASVRTKKSSEEMSLHGRTKVSNFEKAMEKHFGLLVQICFGPNPKPGTSSYYTSGSSNDLSLTKLNAWAESEGYEPFKY